MDKALFTTEELLKDNSIINENVSMVKLRPTIIMCQEMHIQPILGSTLYQSIASEIVNNSLTAENEYLLVNYVQSALHYWIMAESPMILAFRFVNKNIERGSDSNNSMASPEEIQRQIDYWRNKAMWYSERITKYLLANSTDYPDYISPSPDIDTILPTFKNYGGGLVLSRRGRCKCAGKDRWLGNIDRNCGCI